MKYDYGAWSSPITTDLIVTDSVRLGALYLDQTTAYWIEGRPSEGGRSTLIRQDILKTSSQATELTPAPFNVRSRVHEYGGGVFSVSNGIVIFCNDTDGCLYTLTPDAIRPKQITEPSQYRFADFSLDHNCNRVICVAEYHFSEQGKSEPINKLVSVDLKTGTITDLFGGDNFYANPRLSPDGKHLAWISWNHPNMPWDNTQLWLAKLDNAGQITFAEHMTGMSESSIIQPEWSPNGQLYYVCDRNGWWNLYRLDMKRRELSSEPIVSMSAEFGQPQWVFGMSNYGFISEDQICCFYSKNGVWQLARIDLANEGKLFTYDCPWTDFSGTLSSNQFGVLLAASSPSTFSSVMFIEADQLLVDTVSSWHTVRVSNSAKISGSYLSQPLTVKFPTSGNLSSYAFFYPPQNSDFASPEGQKPPLIVMSHGGPTGSTTNGLSLTIQFWTSRGFAVLDVNYGGSTGFGRDYRQRLNRYWGEKDIDDCINGAKYLIQQQWVDPDRVAIRGRSAGGYTTLCALTFRDFFRVGASYYGIGDLISLAEETHKFESRYMDRLIGPYPEEKSTYIERSPINFVERLNCPVIFFQGLKDKIVPPNQAKSMVNALEKKGLPVAYLTFPDEGHGFRQAENIKLALGAELLFYAKVMEIELPSSDQLLKLNIRNADKLQGQ